MKWRFPKMYSLALLSAFVLPLESFAQQEKPKVSSVKVTDSVYMITGRGGNVGVFIGDETTILIDDKFSPLAEAINDEIVTITKTPVEFLLNTHYHGDHTGGNEKFGEAGATIVAHDNVRKILSTGGEIKAFNSKFDPTPKPGLPSITFNDRIVFHVNDQTVVLQHYPSAHTDGDGVVYFESENVIHTGDIFFNGRYPFVDIGNGGSVQGTLAAVESMIAKSDKKTKIIPGHGPVAKRKDLIAYRDMLKTSLDRISALKEKGLSLKQVLAESPIEDIDKVWGNAGIKSNVWISTIYTTLDD